MKIAIASGKGGTGKTTLATNLAAYLAGENDVVLSDLDVEEPNSGLFIKGDLVFYEDKFKMIPEWTGECSLCGLCQEVCHFHAVLQLGSEIMVFSELCHSCYACSELCPEAALPMIPEKMGELKHFENRKLAFVESRLNIGQEQAVPLIAQTNKYVDGNFAADRIKIFDAPPGTACPVIEAVKEVDFVILVTEPTPFGLHDLMLAVEIIRKLGKKFAVVINRDGIGNNNVLDYCQDESIPVLAKIPNMRRIAELYSSGELIYEAIPEVGRQLKNIADYLDKMPPGGDG